MTETEQLLERGVNAERVCSWKSDDAPASFPLSPLWPVLCLLLKPGACDVSTQEVERGQPEIQGHPQLHSHLEGSLGYTRLPQFPTPPPRAHYYSFLSRCYLLLSIFLPKSKPTFPTLLFC